MQVVVDVKLEGIRFKETLNAPNSDLIVREMRNKAAQQVPHLFFTKADDKLREQLDVDGKGDWTDAEFHAFLVNYWNKKLRRHDQQEVLVPRDNRAFLNLLVLMGLAKITEPEPNI